MNPVALAVLKTGLISPELKAQAKKWGAPLDDVGEEIVCETPEQVVEILELALQNEGMVITRVTDLDLIKEFYTTQEEAVLHLTVDNISEDLNIVYGRTRLGDVIIPWRADTVEEVMINPNTYLLTAGGLTVETRFSSVREIYFGDVKAFMLCIVAKEAISDGKPA